MNALLEIVSPGAYASVQDAGRFGYRRIGVPWAGVLDRALMRIANRLVGNGEDDAVIECFDGGQQLRAVEAPLRLAVAGAATLEIVGHEGRRDLPAWRSFVLDRGEMLRVSGIGPARIAVIAVLGLAVPHVMGSASTYARAALGGWQGRALAAGDRMPAQVPAPRTERELPDPPQHEDEPIRVVWGPQHDYFDDTALRILVSSPYRIGTASDRMGMRLEGTALEHRPDRGHEIVSDATVPGAIQVPGTGEPIVLLADAQTVGGYPKIATVISADLARLATRRPGDTVRFTAVDAARGEAIAREAAQRLSVLLEAIRSMPAEGIDLEALYSINLVYGVVDALADEPAPPERGRKLEHKKG